MAGIVPHMSTPTITLHDGTAVPQFGFGVWQVSSEEVTPAVATALEVGYRHIDTAAAYGNEAGVGKAIAESGLTRDEIFITTKLSNADHREFRAREAVEESLERLGVEQLDLYLIHWPITPLGEHVRTWADLVAIKEAGLTRSIGVSNFLPHQLDEIIAATSVVPTVNQIEMHPSLQQAELAAHTTELGIQIESYTPLGLGDFDLPPVQKWAAELGRTPAQVVLRWHLQHGYIVFPKSVTPSRIAENFQVFDFELPGSAMTELDGLESGNRCGQDPATFGMHAG